MSEEGEQEAPWRWKEGVFGGAVMVYMVSATVAGIWWAATLSAKTQDISDKVAAMEHRFDGLDNVSLGNRVTALETQRQEDKDQRDRMERKIDRLLERRINGGSAPTSVRDQ